MKARNRILTLASVLVLSGCAGMSQQACLITDWQTVGYEDGSRGAPAQTIGKYRKACAEHGVAPDLQAYRAGRAEGLRQFCTPATGFSLGERGGRYHGVCPAKLESEFLHAYRSGYRLYELEHAVRATANKIHQKQQQRDEVQTELADKTALIVADETAKEDRVRLLTETAALAHRHGELEEEIRGLERKLAARELERDRYRQQLSHYDPGL